uniref:ORF1ab polyprotein n=1 Tax=Bat Coronavirus MrGD17 TaxID=3018855 RepID=A0AA49IA21_9NIDO|nr:ORF1ab polyprotein [Bat Coronavirus MrGD17]
MACSQYTLAVASDVEINGFGFGSMGDAVTAFSVAAADGFAKCRFVPFGLQDCVVGVGDDDIVMVLTGSHVLNAYLDAFSARPSNIRGWLVFSNCNYVLEDFDVVLGRRGGNTPVYVDNYLCGADGNPVVAENMWSYTNHFDTGVDEIVICGITYVHAWNVERVDVPYEQQNVTTITSIDYLLDVDHKLQNGATLGVAQTAKYKKSVVLSEVYKPLYDTCGSPFVQNGSTLVDIVANPKFFHAIVECNCGRSSYTVGDWSKGFSSVCCGKRCEPIVVVVGDVKPGDIVCTSVNAGTGVKYYEGLTLQCVGVFDNIKCWRVVAVQAFEGFAASATFDENVHTYSLDACSYTATGRLFKLLKMSLLSGVADDAVTGAVVSGVVDLGSNVYNFVDAVMEQKPWFIRKLEKLGGIAWDVLCDAVKAMSVCSSDLVAFIKALSAAAVTVISGKITLLANVPEMFSSVFDTFKTALEGVFETCANTIVIAGKAFNSLFDFVLFDNCIVKLAAVKVVGLKQAGVNTATYANVVIGPTQSVKSSCVEFSNAKLVPADDKVPLTRDGVTVLVDGMAFFYSGGYYRLMSDGASVIEEPTFKTLAEAVEIKPEPVACPEIFARVDGGVIWRTVVDVLESAADFAKGLKVQFGIDGFFGTCSKRFRKVLKNLLALYNEFVESLKRSVVVAGVALHYYAFETPALVIGGVLHTVKKCTASVLGLPCESGVGDFNILSGGEVTVTPNSIERDSDLELLDAEYVEPCENGVLRICDDYAWYYSNDCYYPYGENGVIPVCYKRGGGKFDNQVHFGDDEVKEIPPINNVKLIFEFENDAIAEACKIAIGKRVSFEGGWDDLCHMIDVAMGALSKHVDVPQYYIYDEEGGCDLDLPIMISEWPCDGGDNESALCQADCCVMPDPSIETSHSFIVCRAKQTSIKVYTAKVTTVSVKQCVAGLLHAVEHTAPKLCVATDYAFNVANAVDVTAPAFKNLRVKGFKPVVLVKSDPTKEVEEALSYMKPQTVTKVEKPMFDFPTASFKGKRIIKQVCNNCWLTSAVYQLQLADCYDAADFDLFKVGSVHHFIKRCYESVGAIRGSLGDVTHLLEKLCKDLKTLKVTCDVTCDCGVSKEILEGCVFHFMPTADAFPYGVCSTCSQVAMHVITGIEGTGFFCQEPAAFDITKSLCSVAATATFTGAANGGHYKTNDFVNGRAIDGFSIAPLDVTAPVTNCLVVNANYTQPPSKINPFAVHDNVEFYAGEFAELTSLEFDFVVNAANENLNHGGGVAKAINECTGGQLQVLSKSYVKAHGQVRTGNGAVINCKAFKVLNVVGPKKGGKSWQKLLRFAYETIFKESGVPLTPLLSCGIYGVPLEASLKTLLDVHGDRPVKCFVYTKEEQQKVENFIASIPTVQRDAVEVKPFRTEGKFTFFDTSCLQQDNITVILFTDGLLSLDAIGKFVDARLDGKLAAAIKQCIDESKAIPAGNAIKFELKFTVYMAVVPAAETNNFDKNLARTLRKVSKLEGDVYCNITSLVVLQQAMKVFGDNYKFVANDESKNIIVKCFEPATVRVACTSDGVNIENKFVSSTETYSAQLGNVTASGVDISNTKPAAVDETKVLNVAPAVDWVSHYGFKDAATFTTLDHTPYAFESDMVMGKRALKQTDNNCWINAACLALQYLKPKFKYAGFEAAWNKFVVGDCGEFVHLLYFLNKARKGDLGDAENVLNLLDTFIVPSGQVTLERHVDCNVCRETIRHVNASVVSASLAKDGVDDGACCAHGFEYKLRVKDVKGDCIVTTCEQLRTYKSSEILCGTSYIAFTGSRDGGHYLIYDRATSMVYDGDKCVPYEFGDLSVSACVVKGGYVCSVPKAVRLERIVDSFDGSAKKFFDFGDVVLRNIVSFMSIIFSLLFVGYKALRKRDVKVLAQAPQRTGIILSRSLKYNCKAALKFWHTRSYYIMLILKVMLLMFAIYAAGFMLVRFSFFNGYVCKSYVDGYANSTFVKKDFCKNGLICDACLHGYDQLSDFDHLNVKWDYITAPFALKVYPLVVMAILFVFGGAYVKCLMLYVVAQYVNAAGVYLGFQDYFWPVHVIPFDIFCDEVLAIFVAVKTLLFVKHVIMGCDSPSCIACSKSARLTRIPLTTVVNGANKSFYVAANGGSKFCTKHNFFCVNCDSYGSGSTFINDHVARELSNVTKTSVRATGPAYIEIDRVDFSNGFYRIYSGDEFWRYNFDITEGKYSCKEVLKNCNAVEDFIVYNNTGTNVAQVHNACVYLSQLMCKPIKLVDSALLSTLNVDFNGSLHKAFIDVLQNSFNIELQECSTMAECKEKIGLDVSDDEFVSAVTNAHRYDVLLSEVSFNNYVTSYAKPEEKLSAFDCAQCVRAGAKIVNHNVLVKEKLSVVWLAKDFQNLSAEARKYLVKTSKVKGVNFLLTFNDNVAQNSIPVISMMSKKGAGLKRSLWPLWLLCALIIACYYATAYIVFNNTVSSFAGYDFKYIENGQLKEFVNGLSCVHNTFDNFDTWHYQKFGLIPSSGKQCPIVVGVSDNGRTLPGVPADVQLVGQSLIFTVKTVFGNTDLCYDTSGVVNAVSCIFTSACTVLEGLGGIATYCYKHGIVENSRLYSDLQPNSHYKFDADNYVKLPEVLARGFGMRTVRTQETTYCRVGECTASKAGLCIGRDRWMVYSAESGSDFVCGSSLLQLVYNAFRVFNMDFSTAALSGQMMFNVIVAGVAIASCFIITKFKRVFGDMSYGVFTVICTALVCNLSYFVTQNYLGLYIFSCLYYLTTRQLKYEWIWHIGYVVSYSFLAPWWLMLLYVGVLVLELVPNILKLKVSTHLFEDGSFIANFETAASGTFVLDMRAYEKLVNSIPAERLRQYAASYSKYKYYSGAPGEVDYRLACYAHLAHAMMTFGKEQRDMLYAPPTFSFNSSLQSGLKKMAQPSGIVEPCVVRVSYNRTVLNGLWLGDTVYCPRHVIASNTSSVIDYEHEFTMMRLHNFSISAGNLFLGVVGATMHGANLHIKVNQSNMQTPNYSFRTVKPGEMFNILACYDGVPSGVYSVNMRTNHTIKGSFINGACGSPGYNVVNGVVEFVYMHQIELGSGCHVGSDLTGKIYGGYEDQPTLQIEGSSNLVTENVISFLYGALLNGITWWLNTSRVSVEAFNEWASTSGFTPIQSVDGYSILAAKTGVEVERLLSAIQRLANGFGGRNILGYSSLTDDFTLGEVVKQMFGVSLQSSKKGTCFRALALIGGFFLMFWGEFLMYSSVMWVHPAIVTPLLLCFGIVSVFLSGFIKHKMMFLQTFLLPSIIVLAANNFIWDYQVTQLLVKYFDYTASFFSLDIQGLLNIIMCLFVMSLHTYRFVGSGTNAIAYLSSLFVSAYTYLMGGDPMYCAIMVLCSMSSEWYVGAICYKLALRLTPYMNPVMAVVFGNPKVIVFVYMALGYCTCVYWGFLYWFNRFFKLTLGEYDFKVSSAEFKYMVANGLSAPSGPLDSLILSLRLVGVGGQRTIKISTVQSKLTDLKCANVVLLGCLSSMNIASNSKDWEYCVGLHNKINLCDDPEKAHEMLLALLAFFLSKQQAFGMDGLVDSYFSDNSILQSVAATYVNLPSFVAYETARQNYEDAVNNGSSPQVIKQLRRAMHLAKAEYDREASVQKKIERMAENAAAQMYKEARAENRKSKIISSMHALLFGMLRKLDMSSVDNILNLAKNGVVPLSIIPATSATKLCVVCPDHEAYVKLIFNQCVHYAGVVWNVIDVKDNDGKVVHQKEITKENEEALSWPLSISCERVVKLQNNEIIPTGKLKQMAVKAEGDGFSVEGKALYNNEGGKTFMYAFLADKPDLKVVKWEFEGGCNVIELEAPCRFAVETGSGTMIKYLYFVKNLNTIRRGAVLGFIGATVRLQAGKQTEQASNSSLLTMCAFAVDPAKCYLDAVKSGVKPVGNCIKMLSNGSGTGQAITNGVESNTNQDTYGGASVCLYCRAHVEHPSMDGFCRFKGKYVQVPIGTLDPIRYCLENTVCKVCACWLNNGCQCDRTCVQSMDTGYLNRVRGSSDARLEPLNGTDTDRCVRAFDVYNKDVACIGKFLKVNCVRFQNASKHDAFFVVKRCTKSVMEHEQSMYNELKESNALATHDFFTWKEGRSVYGNISRQDLTKYTMMDLCYALRNFDERNCDTLKEILVLTGCCEESYFDNKSWYDPVENEHIHKVYAKLGVIVANAMIKCVRLCDTMVAKGVVGIITLDNQDLNGDFYDFGDFCKTAPGMGVPCCTSYYSYMMPIMGMTNCLASECFIKSDIFGEDFKTYDLLTYDFTDHKEALFKKYFKYWDQDYHPNCVDCYDEMCMVHCANFNTLFATTIPGTAFGPLCRKVYIDGVPLVATAGYHFKQLGIVWNKDVNTHSSRLSINDLLMFVTDPSLIVASSPALVDQRTVCFSVAALSTGMTQQIVKPGHFNKEFYDFLLKQGFFSEGSELTLKHFFFAQKDDAAVKDFDFYRYNRPTMLDICQARVAYKIVSRYFECYEGGCITAKEVVVTNLNKSAGWPLNKFGKAGLYYESLSYEEQDQLYAVTKRNILPTMTQLNLKYAISGKERARTVGGVSLLSTMTTRQYHQKHLKSIVNTRNAAVVIGTTKFYGGWDNMLKNLINGVENPNLMGWDYPKCDRALPNMIRMISAMVLGSKHTTCCTSTDRFYRLSNELAQVLTEVVYSNGGFYMKPGGTTSGDATTAYANSVFNIFQATCANINRLLSVDSNNCNNIGVKSLQRRLYDCCYRSSHVDDDFITDYYNYLRKHFSLMILSDDGVVCYNSEYAALGYVADISAFKATLYYQNNVFMSTSKCWVEPDVNKGPHEFCSQHTMQIVDEDGKYFLPFPDPSRIISAGVFVDDIVKTDPVILMERYVSLAIDAYPLSKHDNPEYRKVFYALLDWVKHLNKTLNAGILDAFSITMLEDSTSKFWDESFYANLYEKSTVLQAAGLCIVCGSQTVLRCGDCIRRPMLCTKCAYDHVVGTTHKFILSVTPYVCNASGCTVNDVTKLWLGGLSYWCTDHKPQLAFPLCSGGNVFGLYKSSATGSPDVEVFNQLAMSDWTDVKDYKVANSAKDSLRLFAAETVKAKEESVKSQYASATLKEVIGPKELLLSWETGKVKPPLNRNSVFTGFQISKDAKYQVGEFTFEKADYDSDTVIYKSTATAKLVPGMLFVLTSHNVAPLRAPTIANQERYSTIFKLHPAFNIAEAYSQLVPYYQMIGKQRITTIQGPPGSGKSHCAIGLGLYYPGARIAFTACSHAAVDSLCVKASGAYARDRCSRIVPARARVECFSGFKSNNTNAQYIFSTVNALPECSVDIVVVDEISMCTNYDLSIINSRLAYKHIVYVGDPQQLPAPRTMITKGVLEPIDYNVVTQRMCSVGPDIFLHRCFRCPAEIVNTVSELVYENKFKPVNAESKQCFKLFAKGNVQVDNGSSINRHQLDIVKMFLAKNPSWSNAVFISPYNSQNYVAARVLGLQIQTVDSSQGSEYDYVIYTQTSDTLHACNVNRFNVAITRAKKGIFCVMCDRALYDALKFFEVKTSDLQADNGCGLFKNCVRNEVVLSPSHAPTYMALSDRFKTSNELAVAIGTSKDSVRYEHVISFMGFRFDINIPNYHTLFCTRDFAMRNVRGWIGMDVEGAHVCGENVGTNVPLQVGFSNGVDFVVQPEGCVSTEVGDFIKPVRARAPPGDQFTHLVPLIRKGQPWTVVRRRIVQMVSDSLKGLSDIVVFVLWAGGLELTTMRYFVKVGTTQHCYCGKEGRCYNSSTHSYYCFNHATGCDYLYNPFVIDIQQWGYTGSLSLNHHEHCNVHRNEHVASGDAIMTRCLAVYDCFVKNVDWSITYPFICNESVVNKSGRIVQSHIMRAALVVYDPVAIHDIGNPKGIRCAVTSKPWYCYDKQPLNSNVRCLEYDYITHGQMNGLCLFWNCNVDMYPEFSIVCRFDTRCKSSLNLEGCNGGSLYVNNHAFHTPAFDKRAFAKLKAMPFFFYDTSDCDKVQDHVNYVPLRANSCITRCNIGGAVCSKHAELYKKYVEAYNTFTQAGFTLWCPTSFDVYNLWQTFSSNLQGLENIAFNVVKKGGFVGADGELPVAVINDRVMVRDGLTDTLVFTNKTTLPTNVAFELYAKRKLGLTPPLTILKNLGVTATYKHVLWDYEAERPLTPYTQGVCSYTDFDQDVCVCFDNSIPGSFERFTMANNAVLYSTTCIKKLTCIKVNFGYLNGNAVSTVKEVVGGETRDKSVTWYIYTRVNGAFVDRYDGFYTQGRNTADFIPRSQMEKDFLSMDTNVFISKYGLEDFNFEHVVYGDVSKNTLGGLHLLISQVRLAQIGILKVDEFNSADDSTLKCCTVTYLNDPSGKLVCTYMDLLLDDFVTILKSLDLSVVSKVHEVIVDCKAWRWMLWCKDSHVETFYPQLQSAEWKCGYAMPSLYKIQRMCMEPCNLYNYGAGLKLPDGIMFNTLKYTQLCQYLNSTTMCVPHNMRVLHLGAGSDKGVAPGTCVLKRWLPLDAIVVDNDINEYVSDADFSVTGDCNTLFLEDKFDLVISDMYDGRTKRCDGENVSKEGFFPYINGVITGKLSLGGTVAIKITEYSWNKRLYELIQKFEFWTLFCTSVNTSSSEAFVIGVNYLGDFCERPIVDGNTMHANYIFWRNSTIMTMSYNSVLDLCKFSCKHKATVVVSLKDSDINQMVLGLVKSGKLLVRNNNKLCGFSNHLVSTK